MRQVINWILIATITVLTIGLKSANSQIHDPIKWTYESKDLGDNNFELLFTAVLEDHWHVYSQHGDPNEGPIATAFTFNKSSDFKLIGDTYEPKGVTKFEEVFGIEVTYYDHEVTFKQKVNISKPELTISGTVDFMVCNDTECLPPDRRDFKFEIKASNFKADASQDQGTSHEIAPATENQIFTPVKWESEVVKTGDSEYEARFHAKIDDTWHLYNVYLPSQDGPIPTEVTVIGEGIELDGKVIELGDLYNHYDPNFEMELTFFEKEATFVQKFKAKKGVKAAKGSVFFMSCNDERCTTPEGADFEYDLATVKEGKATTEATAVAQAYKHDDGKGHESGEKHGETTVSASSEEGSSLADKSVWTIFILSFLSGLAALMTPCVFPMIPMTVSFFTKQSKSKADGIKNALLYAVSIIVIYVLLGTVVTALFGAEILSNMATDPYFNLVFFVLLIVFAASFLGAFEITLPSSWVNKADNQADKGGIIGIFFMALVLALVSFSCTGPIVGTLIVEAAKMGGSTPVIGMFAFSLALALPFGLFAAFPGWMNSMPKSGGWLNSVKVVLGFLELALAFKFLSNADLVWDLHFFEREVFLAIWIIIFGFLTLYLLGKITLPHDSPDSRIGVGRLFLAVAAGAFTIYLIPGMWGAPLKLISAFPPPLEYSESPQGVGFTGGGGHHDKLEPGQHHGPQGLAVFHDYEDGLAYAKKKKLPIMIDFTGKACVNCRKMEQNVWSDPEIKNMLATEVVVISLYVDSRIELPKEEQIEIIDEQGNKKKLITEGNKWAAMQISDYKSNTQPLYVVKDYNGKDVGNSANYEKHGSIPVFKAWLREGIYNANK